MARPAVPLRNAPDRNSQCYGRRSEQRNRVTMPSPIDELTLETGASRAGAAKPASNAAPSSAGLK